MIHQWIEELTSINDDLRYRALEALPQLGPEVRDAIPALETALRGARSRGDEGVAGSIAYALAAIWIKDLTASDPSLRSRAIEALQQLGPEGQSAVMVLVTALREARSRGERSVATYIVRGLGAIGQGARYAVPLLVSSLPRIGYTAPQGIPRMGGEAVEEECAAAEAILRIGAEAFEEELAVRSMLRRAEPEEDPYKDRLTYIILLLRPQLMKDCAGKIISALANLLTDAEETTGRLRAAAAQCLGTYGPQATEAVPALIAALKDQAVSVRYNAALALAAVQPARKTEISLALLSLLPRDDLTPSICTALSRVGGDAVPHLLPLLCQSTGEAKLPYLQVLHALGVEAKGAVSALIDTLTDQDARVRLQTVSVLGEIGVEAKAAVPALIDALKDDNAALRGAAIVALGKIGGQAAVQAFHEAFKSLDNSERCHVVSVLGKAGVAAVAALIIALMEGGYRVRRDAVRAFGAIGADAKAAVPALTVALKDEFPYVRRAAAEALARIGPAAQEP
jgi:HEAT repeat protein